jgi:hypothetical protein
MRRAILFLILGVFGAALVVSSISVYIVHDVDRDKAGHLSEAFLGLCVESVLFALIVGGIAGFLALVGRHLFRLTGSSPRANPALFLGLGVPLFQYAVDLAVRRLFPQFTELSLTLYLVVAIVFCAAVLLYDSFRQANLAKMAGS